MGFKIAFAAAFGFAVFVAAGTAKLAARRHGGALNQLTHEIRWLLWLRGALGLIFYAALGAWMFWPGALAWSYLEVPLPVRWLAVALLVPTLAFFAWSFRSLGESYRGGIGLYEDHVLVTAGAYRLLRHPIYVSFIAVMLLVFVLSANWLLGLSGLLLVTSIAAARIPTEERELRERFGAAWTAYSGETGRLIPRLR